MQIMVLKCQLLHNQFNHIRDNVSGAAYAEDIDDQPLHNYRYDAIGNLLSDSAEGISSIEWTVYGKIQQITRSNGTRISYSYDAAGNRISKSVQGTDSTTQTWYVRDGSGNVMSIYVSRALNGSIGWGLRQTEVHLYGSSRLGILRRAVDVVSSYSIPSQFSVVRGNKFFELSNHLGNVLATVSDKKTGHGAGGGTIDYYEADIVSASDYAPFGMQLAGRTFNTGDYRYGFNGKENDNEVKGEGNQQDYGMRIYDPRIGKFLSVDPLTRGFAMLTPYQYASNSPISHIDLDGEEGLWYIYAKAGVYGQKTAQIINGTEDGVKETLSNAWDFIRWNGNAWKGETWKQAGLFLEEATLSMSTVKISETPRVDAKVQNFNDNVINGDAYSRSKWAAGFTTDILIGIAADKGLGNIKSFVANTVKTDWVIAKQSLSIGALKGAVEAKNGATLYRIGTTRKSAQGAAAQYWSLENPLLDPEGYAKKYNVPLENIKNANFIETAVLKKGANFITREAGSAPGSANTGKGIEVVVDKGGTTNNVIKPIKRE